MRVFASLPEISKSRCVRSLRNADCKQLMWERISAAKPRTCRGDSREGGIRIRVGGFGERLNRRQAAG
jgi:hypothetical protein